MLDRNEYMPLQYLVKQKWSGSYQGMRFMLQKRTSKSEQEEITVLEAACWKEPYSYEATSDENKTFCQFPLTEEGRLQAIEWLEREYEERKDEWTAARKWDWEQ